MNLFNFLRFSNIESKKNNKKAVFRLAQKKNGKFVLVNDNGKIVSPECDWISNELLGVRLYDNGGIVSYFANNDGNLASSSITRVKGELSTAKEARESAENEVLNQKSNNGTLTLPEEVSDAKVLGDGKTTAYFYKNSADNKIKVFATAEDDGITQIFVSDGRKNNGTFILTSDKKMSDVFSRLTAANKNGLRLGWINGKVEVVSKDALESYDKFNKVTEPDGNGVRIGIEDILDYYMNDEAFPYVKEIKSLLPKNFDKTSERFTDIQSFDGENYLVTARNDKQMIVDKTGKNVAGRQFSSVSEPNALGEVIASTNKAKSNNGIVLIHEGKRYKKVKDVHRVLDSAPIGIKAMKYGKELNQNVVAGVNISNGIEIDEDANRVLIALLKGEKPKQRFWKSIEENNKFDALFAGVSAYETKLDEIASAKPELRDEILEKKQNLSKTLSTLLKRKVAGHKTYEKAESRRIEEKRNQIENHSENISNSSSKRQVLSDAVNNFEK